MRRCSTFSKGRSLVEEDVGPHASWAHPCTREQESGTARDVMSRAVRLLPCPGPYGPAEKVATCSSPAVTGSLCLVIHRRSVTSDRADQLYSSIVATALSASLGRAEFR